MNTQTRPSVPSLPSQASLEAQATEFLSRSGFRSDGRPKSEKSESVRAISTPVGGKPATWSKK